MKADTQPIRTDPPPPSNRGIATHMYEHPKSANMLYLPLEHALIYACEETLWSVGLRNPRKNVIARRASIKQRYSKEFRTISDEDAPKEKLLKMKRNRYFELEQNDELAHHELPRGTIYTREFTDGRNSIKYFALGTEPLQAAEYIEENRLHPQIRAFVNAETVMLPPSSAWSPRSQATLHHTPRYRLEMVPLGYNSEDPTHLNHVLGNDMDDMQTFWDEGLAAMQQHIDELPREADESHIDRLGKHILAYVEATSRKY